MLGRRVVLTGLCAAPVASMASPSLAAAPEPAPAPSLPVPRSDKIAFRMLRNGAVIGQHALTFTRNADALVVAVEIDILVKLGPIPVYRYKHRATEKWQQNQLMALTSDTNHDGSQQFVRAIREAAGLVVTGSKAPRYTAPEGVLATTYWNKAMLGSPPGEHRVINSEDGRLFDIGVTDLAQEPVKLANGGTQLARHFRTVGQLALDLWYDDTGQWAHLEFSQDGSTIIYEKLS